MTSATPAADILAAIADYKRAEVAVRRARPAGPKATSAPAGHAPRGFRDALRRRAAAGRPALIAEIKKASPSRGLIRPEFDPAALARDYAAGGAACLSVLTDGPSFLGCDADLVAARAICDLPVLRKDFLVDPWQVAESRDLGADAVLVIMAMLDDETASAIVSSARELGMDVLVEVHDADEMVRALALGAEMIGVNSRDLRSFLVDLNVFERLAPLAPAGTTLVAESGIAGLADVGRVARAGAQAMLVGESLMRMPDVAAAARALLQGSEGATR